MEPLGQIIPNIWSFPGWQKRLRAGEVLARWEEIVGPAIAQVARPKAFSQGCLQVEVEDSVWMTRLRFEERRLLARLNEIAQEELFRKIRWGLAKRPFRRLQKPAAPRVELSPELLAKAREEVEVIQDPDLREAFLRLRLTLLAKRRGLRLRGYRDHQVSGR